MKLASALDEFFQMCSALEAGYTELDAKLMEIVFDKLGRRTPYDMSGFLADGKRQMICQNVPDEVSAVMNRFAEKCADNKPH